MNLGQEIRTVLVTGGTGFVGGAVARRLRSENCTVRTLVRRNSDTAALTAAGCELRTGDITDAASVIEAMEGADAAVHCAAFASRIGLSDLIGENYAFPTVDAAVRSLET
jgi:uncharacterized protein YbjT (DUF2867 family)